MPNFNIDPHRADPRVFEVTAEMLSAYPERYDFMAGHVPRTSDECPACMCAWLLFFNGERAGTPYDNSDAIRRLGYKGMTPELYVYDDIMQAADVHSADGQVSKLTAEQVALGCRVIAQHIRRTIGQEVDA